MNTQPEFDMEESLPPFYLWAALSAADYQFNQPFCVEMIDGKVLTIDAVLRIVPKKRMVVRGRYQQHQVIAKIFYDPQSSVRHAKKEISGIKLLNDNNIPAPRLLNMLVSKDRRIHVLLFNFIQAENVQSALAKMKNDAERNQLLQLLMIEIATQHALGIVQKDLHLDNFLYQDDQLYTLDGSQILEQPLIYPRKKSIQNLSLLLSQLGAGTEDQQRLLFTHYAQARGWILKDQDFHFLAMQIQRFHNLRWEQYMRKIFRNSSHFLKIHERYLSGMVRREYLTPTLSTFLKEPELFFQHPSAISLKNGRSATVMKVNIDDRLMVIKRYNIKNWRHRLRRLFRSSRATLSWRIAHKCELFRINVAPPIAYIERRQWGSIQQSYYISEFVSATDVGISLRTTTQITRKVTQIIKRTVQTLEGLAALGIAHGDLKATNILIDQSDNPVLIDFDGAKEFSRAGSLQRAIAQDKKRLIQNFSDQPLLQQYLLKILNQ